MIIDSYGREIDYLRLAVTDRCNLRCTYCMPENGLDWLSRKELMSLEEMLRICALFVKMGVKKIRITGGEPFVRRDISSLLQHIACIDGLNELTLTTNGLLTGDFVPELKSMGVKSVNLSLDTLDKDRFLQITRRNGLDAVLATLHKLIDSNIKVKINTVVMGNTNIADIVPLVQLTEKLPISVRFIEEMPFNGGDHGVALDWDFVQILEYIRLHFSNLVKTVDPPHSTSYTYKIPGYNGDVGIIAAYTRSFCGTCNRIRITPTGVMRTCLYDSGTLNLKDAMREGKTDHELQDLITSAILKKPIDGWEAQNLLVHQSMATIGG